MPFRIPIGGKGAAEICERCLQTIGAYGHRGKVVSAGQWDVIREGAFHCVNAPRVVACRVHQDCAIVGMAVGLEQGFPEFGKEVGGVRKVRYECEIAAPVVSGNPIASIDYVEVSIERTLLRGSIGIYGGAKRGIRVAHSKYGLQPAFFSLLSFGGIIQGDGNDCGSRRDSEIAPRCDGCDQCSMRAGAWQDRIVKRIRLARRLNRRTDGSALHTRSGAMVSIGCRRHLQRDRSRSGLLCQVPAAPNRFAGLLIGRSVFQGLRRWLLRRGPARHTRTHDSRRMLGRCNNLGLLRSGYRGRGPTNKAILRPRRKRAPRTPKGGNSPHHREFRSLPLRPLIPRRKRDAR